MLNLHWDDFPLLYFHNTYNRYVTGLDPNFLYYAFPEKASILRKPKILTPRLVQDEFNARYLVAKRYDVLSEDFVPVLFEGDNVLLKAIH